MLKSICSRLRKSAESGPLWKLFWRWDESHIELGRGYVETWSGWSPRFRAAGALHDRVLMATRSPRALVGHVLTLLVLVAIAVWVLLLLTRTPEGTVTLTEGVVIGPLRCRAKKSRACQHGRDPVAASVEMGGEEDPEDEFFEPWTADGTYLRGDHSIVCTPCYVSLGVPLNPVAPGLSAGPMDDENKAYLQAEAARSDARGYGDGLGS